MAGDFNDLMLTISVMLLPLILAITFHEAAHGFVAWRCGDDTAYRMGRVTFNPLRHIDPFGTIILPLMLRFATGFAFGYAKPVPVNANRFRNYRRDMILVAAAGPGSNLILGFVSALLLHAVPFVPAVAQEWLAETLTFSIMINVVLALFNMLPLLPLDGGRVLSALLPRDLAIAYQRTERWGMFVLIGLLVILPLLGSQFGVDINILGWILGPAYSYVSSLIGHLAGLDSLAYR
jgi:Zn-dependent protease